MRGSVGGCEVSAGVAPGLQLVVTTSGQRGASLSLGFLVCPHPAGRQRSHSVTRFPGLRLQVSFAAPGTRHPGCVCLQGEPQPISPAQKEPWGLSAQDTVPEAAPLSFRTSRSLPEAPDLLLPCLCSGAALPPPPALRGGVEAAVFLPGTQRGWQMRRVVAVRPPPTPRAPPPRPGPLRPALGFPSGQGP